MRTAANPGLGFQRANNQTVSEDDMIWWRDCERSAEAFSRHRHGSVSSFPQSIRTSTGIKFLMAGSSFSTNSRVLRLRIKIQNTHNGERLEVNARYRNQGTPRPPETSFLGRESFPFMASSGPESRSSIPRLDSGGLPGVPGAVDRSERNQARDAWFYPTEGAEPVRERVEYLARGPRL